MSVSASLSVSSPFADILPMLDHLPALPAMPDGAALGKALQVHGIEASTYLPVLNHLQRWQKKMPTLNHPRLCLFASHYTNGEVATQKTITDLQSDRHPLKVIAAHLNADLRVYELDLEHSHRAVEDAAQAMTYGMLAIEEKGDALIIGSLSAGAETAAHNIKFDHPMNAETLLQTLAPQMGLDFFAALGACLAARLAGQSVVLCGAFGALLQQVLTQLHSDAAAHILVNETENQTMPPLFAAAHLLQQTRFLMAFLPVTHVQLV
jgi:hypothetical protein